MMTVVSLITGCYNGEKFIPRCFQSILEQTFDDMEVIFVDDGSTDRSLQLAESYRNKFAERGFDYRIIAQSNMGFYPQSGIKVASGKYITTLDIDDILLPESIEKRAEFLKSHPDFSAVRTNGFIVREHEPTRQPVLFERKRETLDDKIFEDLLYGVTNNWPGTFMVTARALFEIYPDRVVPMDRFTQNLQILLPVAYQRKVGFINTPLMHYMRHAAQFTADGNDYETTKKQFEAFKEVRKKILQQMNLLSPAIDAKLDRTYDTIFLRLAHRFNNTNALNTLFRTIKTPDFEERFLHASINKKKLTVFLMRVQNRIGLRQYNLRKKFRSIFGQGFL